MASASPSMDVKEEVKCPICMEFLTNPVTLDCGHNFCRGCISGYCEKWEDLGDLECPLCKTRIKKGNFRPNWQLANIAEKIKGLSLSLGKEHVCERHQEKLNLFCKEDQELVCVICERSPEHKSHTVLLLEEAAKECKDHLCIFLDILRRERQQILRNKAGTEQESQELLTEIEQKKTRTEAVFSQLHQFLEEQKMVFLSQLEEQKKETITRGEEHMARLSKELSSLEGLIQQMEKNCQQPANELLQDIRETLQRYKEKKKFGNHLAFPSELTCRIKGFCDAKPILEGVMKQWELIMKQANVTLDPDTAHPNLILSEDWKSVKWTPEYRPAFDIPMRIEDWPCVLGYEGFTAGRHFWEVTVGSEGHWAVGVARKSMRRKDMGDLGPAEGVWAVGRCTVLNPFVSAPLSLSQEIKKIRVTLDCDEGQVAFHDADTGIHIHTYSGASFYGETLLPFFFVSDGAHLSLSP